ncbi:DUF4062 domain-containing protein [Shewanella mangrovi]|uniref:DUF4062 domain-containing protein n=1 Tax=Shewanella mangrovi TaxID=1515746 RepID=UPI0006917106|nr:DUF4062 domain-containing protein [Shewanella mangrovi]
MASTRKIIRAFLASPGDLQDERKAIREVVNEFNDSWADALGYQVELIGWEETVAGFGRPQELINQDLDRCDLFIGMIWKRWGTPPDTHGKFSSGFEEEFSRTMDRRERTGSPEISLFFKEIPDEFMSDPGEDLKKVISFKEKIISNKKILYQVFLHQQGIEQLTRKSITSYVIRVKDEVQLSEPDELKSKNPGTCSVVGEGDVNKDREPSLLSVEGFAFLKKLIERIESHDSLNELQSSDIARFRLLANTLSKQGNDEINLGVHDINILFTACSEGLELGRREIQILLRLGFQHLATENVPIWRWYSEVSGLKLNPAIISAYIEVNDNCKVGAISVLTVLEIELPIDNQLINREKLVNSWFSEKSSSRVRTAALRYLAKCGNLNDIDVVNKEYDKSDYGTSREALECLVEILLRNGKIKETQRRILKSQFETLNFELLNAALSGFEGLEADELLLGIEHRNPQVRLTAIKSLSSKNLLDVGLLERLLTDSNALVREQALSELSKLGKRFSEDDVKRILIKPREKNNNVLLGTTSRVDADTLGEKYFEKYRYEMLKSLAEAELIKVIETSTLFDDAPYFALTEKYFKKHSSELRRNVDDRFCKYFGEGIRRVESMLGDGNLHKDLVKDTRNLEEYWRKCLTRKGLNLLCTSMKAEDLHRIRANLRDGYTEASNLDALYLGKFGEWIDIQILANAKQPTTGNSLLGLSGGDDEYRTLVAKAITSIAKGRSISDFLALDIPPHILTKTIDVCSESRFSQISNDTLLHLFNHEADSVRKAAALMAVKAFSAKRIKAILYEYISGEKYRYYNVIHWLDLGASLSRSEARKVALANNCS